jgi:predicted metalloprotease with PDZ domain
MNEYLLRVAEPQARRLDVELQVEPRGAATLDFRLPVWTPGSYLIREHERHVDGLRAFVGGAEVPAVKVDKQTWRVRCAGDAPVRIAWRLQCFELTVRTNHVDPTHAFVNPSAALLFAVGREAEPCAVRLQMPAGWRSWVALPVEGGAYRARDYDELADSPFELGAPGAHESHTFEAQGVPHELVVWGRGDFDGKRAVPDMVKIIDALSAVFGGLPYRDKYLFILHLNDKARGGLEHRQSCALIVPRFSFVQKSAYEDFLELVAHEFFHLWNVKRLRPAAFTPYDWTRENHTGLLWAMEGLTSTYEVIALRRAGLITPERFLEIWAERLTQLLRTPGRLRVSLAQASYDAWIKHYRPDETTANTSVSYYLKGSVVGFLLDLELRRRTRGARSLDDLVRRLFERHGAPPGLPEDGVERAAVELGGEGLAGWFDRAIRSTQELPAAEALEGAGIAYLLRPAKGGDDKGSVSETPVEPEAAQRGWLGAALRDRSGALEVASVVEGSPAQQSGLGAGDELVAFDGFRGDLKARLSRAQPGQTVRLTLFRMDELLEIPVRLGETPRDTVTLAPAASAGEAEQKLREAWLGVAWPIARSASRE